MSLGEHKRTAERWLLTADGDLRAAHVLADSGMHAHACFSAQQAAEKALKGLWFWHGDDPWGHSVQKLLLDRVERDPRLTKHLEDAASLDRYYIPTRYPNGLPDLTPSDNYSAADSTDAIRRASAIVATCRALMAEHDGQGSSPS
jgi:HEPN domain-containing protein